MSGTGSTSGGNVFVLDISGSMSGMRCQTLQLSATRILEDIPDNSYAGIVLFDDRTQLCHSVVKITNRQIRDNLKRSVPMMARGATNIGAGILFGVQTLQSSGILTDGTLFLFTDGEHNQHPLDYVSHVLPTLLNAKIRVVCIAIGNDADGNLERLATETGGKIFFAGSANTEMIARVLEAAIQEVKSSTELAEAINISICDETIDLNQMKLIKNIIIDSDVGKNTVITIGSTHFDKISVNIESPNGNLFDSSSPELLKDSALKRFQLKLKIADPGIWAIILTKHCTQTISANISVKSQPSNPKAIQMKVTLENSNGINPPIIITELRKGNDAVIGAEVVAVVDRPDGTQIEMKLNNYNNIYCNFFTDYCGSGRYNVTVLAHNKGLGSQLKSLNSKNIVSSSVPQFERQLIVGCFKVTDCMPQRPISDHKLHELSLDSAFNSVHFNTTMSSIEAPAPRNIKAVIKPKIRAVPQTNGLIEAKVDLNNLVLLVKKSINSKKINENERNDFKKTIDEINTRLSLNSTTIQELNNYLKQLNEIKSKLF